MVVGESSTHFPPAASMAAAAEAVKPWACRCWVVGLGCVCVGGVDERVESDGGYFFGGGLFQVSRRQT